MNSELNELQVPPVSSPADVFEQQQTAGGDTGGTEGILFTPMRRRVFTILAAFWLLLCSVASVFWIHTYSKGMWVEHAWVRQRQGEPRLFWLQTMSRRGLVRFELLRRHYQQHAMRSASKTAPSRVRETAADDARNELLLANAIAADINRAAAYQRTAGRFPPLTLMLPDPWYGFEARWYEQNSDRNIALQFPYWFATVITAGSAFLCWRLRGRKFTKGCSAACGYDLRATPEKCPECRTVAAKM